MIYFKSNSRRKCAIELMHLRLDDCFVLSTKGESDWMAPKLWGGLSLDGVENLFFMFFDYLCTSRYIPHRRLQPKTKGDSSAFSVFSFYQVVPRFLV
jgi:hypothetical protein